MVLEAEKVKVQVSADLSLVRIHFLIDSCILILASHAGRGLFSKAINFVPEVLPLT